MIRRRGLRQIQGVCSLLSTTTPPTEPCTTILPTLRTKGMLTWTQCIVRTQLFLNVYCSDHLCTTPFHGRGQWHPRANKLQSLAPNMRPVLVRRRVPGVPEDSTTELQRNARKTQLQLAGQAHRHPLGTSQAQLTQVPPSVLKRRGRKTYSH